MAARRVDAVAPEGPRFHSVAATAVILGVSEVTLYRAIAAGEFPAVRIRGRLIVPVGAVEAMAEAAWRALGRPDTATDEQQTVTTRQSVVDPARWVPKDEVRQDGACAGGGGA